MISRASTVFTRSRTDTKVVNDVIRHPWCGIRASTRIASIRGSYSGIMGLPLRETAQLIEDWVKID